MSQEMLLVMGHLCGSMETAPDRSAGSMVWERHRQGPRVPLAQQGPNREDQVQAGTRWVKNLVPLCGLTLMRERQNLQRGVS